MNTANLQLEGLYSALSAILAALRDKGLLTREEIEAALAAAEDAAAADPGRPMEISAANVEAVRFPIRYLRATNAADGARPFSQVATAIGQAKPQR